MNLLNLFKDLYYHLFKKAKYRQDTTSNTGSWDSYSCLLQPVLQRKSKEDLKWGGLEKLREQPSHATLGEWPNTSGFVFGAFLLQGFLGKR